MIAPHSRGCADEPLGLKASAPVTRRLDEVIAGILDPIGLMGAVRWWRQVVPSPPRPIRSLTRRPHIGPPTGTPPR
jgi:hypothetical protein